MIRYDKIRRTKIQGTEKVDKSYTEPVRTDRTWARDAQDSEDRSNLDRKKHDGVVSFKGSSDQK